MCVKLFLLVFTAYFITSSGALDPGDVGVCVIKQSFQESKRVTFSVRSRKYCGKPKCYIQKAKIVNRIISKNQTICCYGWQHDSERDACVPVCSTGCINGTCVAPDVCQCEPHMRLDPLRHNSCVPPVCDQPCSGAQCSNNTCECLPHHQRYNDTHCVNCDEGYTVNSELKCIPKCDPQCLNSVCIAPNTCKCLEGYRSKDAHTCDPVCDCVNAVCVGPKICSCLLGYSAVNATFCAPLCDDCSDGKCSEICICRDGFEKVAGVCKPVCTEACVNGVCSAPNVCECSKGYTKNASRPAVCYKACVLPCDGFCDAEGVCHKKMCKYLVPKTKLVTKRSYTWKECKTKPPCITKSINRYKVSQLKCCSGWLYKSDKKFCEPICNSGCLNGTCVSPDTCHCDPPLQLRNGACIQPECTPVCGSNSVCTDTNTCTCNEGFLAINETHCAPRCPPGYFNDPIECKPKCKKCVNGMCSAPEVCDCNMGYIKIDNHTCGPVCTPSCENANCVDPNSCACLEGFTKVNPWKCAPVCVNCINGDCVAPGSCKCHEGYEKRGGVCEPVCESPCANGTCVEPNKCRCNVGYELDPHNQFNCLPICEPKCVNASCVSPNTCSCYNGYETAENNWTCKPRCDRCNNGDCIEPNNCQCHTGYEGMDGKCEPKCSKACVNGFCSLPEECTCFDGFSPSLNDKYICNPICEPDCVNSSCVAPGECKCFANYVVTEVRHVCKPHCETCVNGDCVDPGVCQCHPGYNKTHGACSPVCSSDCINSLCTLPDVCTCIEGFTKNLTLPSECYKECAGPCDHGTCDLYGNCVCDPGYELLNDTCYFMDPVDCSECLISWNCSESSCSCAGGEPCVFIPTEVAPSTSLAGLELSWMLGAAVGFLLIVFLLVVIVRIGKNKQHAASKAPDDGPYGSVVFTVPETLMHRKYDEENQERFYEEVTLDGRRREERDTAQRLLEGPADERL